MKTKNITRLSAIPIVLAIFLLIFAPFTISLTSADVTELDVPPWVVQGEALSISGKASPDEVVWISSSFEISLPVSDGEYYGEFIGIEFPEGEKTFSVTAENIKNIRISLCCVFWQTIEYPSEGPLNATDGIATISISFPVELSGVEMDIYGKKDVTVYGGAAEDATSVNLNVATSIKVTADSNGDFTLDMNTEGVPIGKFWITARGEDGEPIEKTVEVVSTEPTPTPTPAPTPTQAITSTPSPTITPQTTPIKDETEEKSLGPTPQNETSQPTQETTKPFRIPGFESVGCITALIIVIMLAKKGKK